MSTHKNILNKGNKKGEKKIPKNSKVSSNSLFENQGIKPRDESEIVFYSENVKKSQRHKDHEFLNHLNNKTLPKNKDIVDKFKDNLKELHVYFDFEEEKVNINRRLKDIFSLYMQRAEVDNLGANVCKARIKTLTGTSTGFRIFLYKDFDQKQYKIFLLDPHHLVIPSEYQRKEKTYLNERDSSICISKLF